MNEEIPSWAALLIGGGIGIFLIGLLLVSISGVGNVKRKKDAKRQANNEDNIPFDLPNYGYDSSARHLPTELEKEVEMDEVEVAKIQAGADRVREEELRRKRRGKKKSRRFRNRIGK